MLNTLYGVIAGRLRDGFARTWREWVPQPFGREGGFLRVEWPTGQGLNQVANRASVPHRKRWGTLPGDALPHLKAAVRLDASDRDARGFLEVVQRELAQP